MLSQVRGCTAQRSQQGQKRRHGRALCVSPFFVPVVTVAQCTLQDASPTSPSNRFAQLSQGCIKCGYHTYSGLAETASRAVVPRRALCKQLGSCRRCSPFDEEPRQAAIRHRQLCRTQMRGVRGYPSILRLHAPMREASKTTQNFPFVCAERQCHYTFFFSAQLCFSTLLF